MSEIVCPDCHGDNEGLMLLDVCYTCDGKGTVPGPAEPGDAFTIDYTPMLRRLLETLPYTKVTVYGDVAYFFDNGVLWECNADGSWRVSRWDEP